MTLAGPFPVPDPSMDHRMTDSAPKATSLPARRLRVLFCNWIDWRDPGGRGGGVAVYQRNMAAALAGSDIEAGYLVSGLAHDLRPGAHPRWRQRRGQARGPSRHWEIVNSGVLAPGHAAFGDARQISHPPTEAAFGDFLARTGPWDVVHFDSLEGFPAGVMGVAHAAGCRVAVMLHNHYPICPQVNLWQRERRSCTDFDQGRACIGCLVDPQPGHGARRLNMAISGHLAHLGGTGAVDMWRDVQRGLRKGLGHVHRHGGAGDSGPAAPPDPARAAAFAARRLQMVGLINRHADVVVCVSGRVARIAAQHGIRPDLLQVARIGTPEAGRYHQSVPRALINAQGRIHLAYLGYMRRDKGCLLLIETIEGMPDDLASRIELTVAARGGLPEDEARLQAAAGRLAVFRRQDGYRAEELDRLLGAATLGLVPVMWEDNLPQVAIEMHLRRIPLLTTDLGGARELLDCPDLVVPAGDAGAIRARLRAIVSGHITQARIWNHARAPVTMDEHLAVMARLWGLAMPPTRVTADPRLDLERS